MRRRAWRARPRASGVTARPSNADSADSCIGDIGRRGVSLAEPIFGRQNNQMAAARPTKCAVLLLAGLFLAVHLLIGGLLILEVGGIFGRAMAWQEVLLAPFEVEFIPWY